MCAKVENAQVGQLKRAQEPWEGKNVYKYIKLTRFQKRFPNIVFCVVAALKSSVSCANLDPLFCIKTVHGRYFANTKLYLRAVTDIDFFAVLIRNHFLITYCRLAITKSAKKLSNSAGKLVFLYSGCVSCFVQVYTGKNQNFCLLNTGKLEIQV